MRSTIPYFLLISILSTVPAAQAGKLYRWVDAEGNVHYTDQIPPEQAERSHQELSEEGVRTHTIPRAKTQEEIEEERRLERLRAEQQRLIEKQKAADRVLLRTFRSEDDLIMARDGKLTAIDLQIKVTRGNIRRYQERLTDLQHKAATRERTGKPVSETLLANIDTTVRQINDAYTNIERKEQDKNAIREVFARDLKRFRELKNTTVEPLEEQEQETGILPNLADCADPQACDKAWERAEAFVREHATTPMQMLSDTIIMTATPIKDQDVSITVSRVKRPKSDDTVLFMDLFCKDTPAGKEHCEGESVSAVRRAFRPTVGGTATEQSGK